MKIILHGYTGKMGQIVQEVCAENDEYEIAAMIAFDSQKEADHCYRRFEECNEEADLVIDFSSRAATEALLAFCVKRNLPLVLCTTGQTEEEKQMIKDASKTIPVFFSANFSLGVAVLASLARQAAAMFPDADIEILEKHHNRKADAPSGTALLLADEIKEVRTDAVYAAPRGNRKRQKNEIGISSLRMGNEVGTHEIYINTGSECLTLTHQAYSRAVFAEGALKAAEYLLTKEPGLYNMKDMVAEI